MSRAAAEDGFERFLDATVSATREEFSVGRALRGTGFGASGLVVDRLRENADGLERRLLEPELARYRERALEQFRVVLDYAEGDEPIESYRSELLAHDSYVQSFREDLSPERREVVIGMILDRNRRLGDAIAPLVSRPEAEFWAATTACFDRSAAIDLVERAFPFTGPLRAHRDAFVFTVDLDPSELIRGAVGLGLPSMTIEYTDEAVRAMVRAERRVVHETKDEVRRRYGDR